MTSPEQPEWPPPQYPTGAEPPHSATYPPPAYPPPTYPPAGYEAPGYALPGYPPPGYPQPGYPPPAYPPASYPAPAGYPTHAYGPGYPPPYNWYGYPMAAGRPRVSAQWTGGLLAGAGLLTVIGSFMTWAKVVAGGLEANLAGTDGHRDGKITLAFGLVMLGVGIVILARQGRLWTGIVGIVMAALTVITALVDIGDIARRGDQLAPYGRIDVGAGIVLVLVAAVAGLVAAIVAVAVRRS